MLSSEDNSSLTDSLVFYTAAVFILFIVSLVVALENLFVLVSIGIFTCKRYSISPFLCSLSLADIIQFLGPVTISLHVYTSTDSSKSQGFQHHFSLCSTQSWLMAFLHMTSMLSIVMLAIDRNISLTKQSFYRRKWKGLFLVVIVVACWVFSAFISSLQMLEADIVKPTSFCPHIYCLFTPDSGFAVIFASLHLVLIIICGISVIHTTSSSRHSLFRAAYSSASGKIVVENTRNLIQEEYTRRMSRMVSIVVCLYCICHLPWMIAIFLGYFNIGYPQLYGLLSLQMPMVSGLCNPLLYGLVWLPYRNAYVNTLKAPLRMCRKRPRNSHSHSLKDSSRLSRSYRFWSAEGFNSMTAEHHQNSIKLLFGPSSHSNKPIDLMPEELRMFENEGLMTDNVSLDVNTSSYEVTDCSGIHTAAANIALDNSAQFQSILDLIEEMTDGKTRGNLSFNNREPSKTIDSKNCSTYWSAEKNIGQPHSNTVNGFRPSVHESEPDIECYTQERKDSVKSGIAGCVCIGKSKSYVIDKNRNRFHDCLVANEVREIDKSSKEVIKDPLLI